MNMLRRIHPGYAIVAIVALAGGLLSATHLAAWTVQNMHAAPWASWLTPVTFDLCPTGLTIMVHRARRDGRGAVVFRLLIVAFAGISAYINYSFVGHGSASWIAALLPLSACALLEAIFADVAAGTRDKSTAVAAKFSVAACLLHPVRAGQLMRRRSALPLDAMAREINAYAVVAAQCPPRRTQRSLVATQTPLALTQGSEAQTQTQAVQAQKQEAQTQAQVTQTQEAQTQPDERKRTALEMLARGVSTKDVASQTGASLRTVQVWRKTLLATS